MFKESLCPFFLFCYTIFLSLPVELPPEGKACNGGDFVELPPRPEKKCRQDHFKLHDDYLNADFVELPSERVTGSKETQERLKSHSRQSKENKVIIFII